MRTGGIALHLACPKHPLYRAIRRPRVPCGMCHDLWFLTRWALRCEAPDSARETVTRINRELLVGGVTYVNPWISTSI